MGDFFATQAVLEAKPVHQYLFDDADRREAKFARVHVKLVCGTVATVLDPGIPVRAQVPLGPATMKKA
jgi:hypothetical protein